MRAWLVTILLVSAFGLVACTEEAVLLPPGVSVETIVYNNSVVNITNNITIENNYTINITQNITQNVTIENNYTQEVHESTAGVRGWEDDFFDLAQRGPVWYIVAISTGSLSGGSSYPGEANHPGVIGFRSNGTANTGYAIGASGGSTTSSNLLLNGSECSTFIIKKLELASNASVTKMGFIDTFSTTEPVDGVYFRCVTQTCIGVTRNNNAEYNTTTQGYSNYNLTLTEWFKFKVCTSPNLVNATFQIINGTDGSTVLWQAHVNNTRIPSASGRETAHGISTYMTTAGASTLDILKADYMNLVINRSMTR